MAMHASRLLVSSSLTKLAWILIEPFSTQPFFLSCTFKTACIGTGTSGSIVDKSIPGSVELLFAKATPVIFLPFLTVRFSVFGRDSTSPCEACSWIISFHISSFFCFLGLFRVTPGRGAPTAKVKCQCSQQQTHT